MSSGFPFGQYFGDIGILADLQLQDRPRPFADRPPRDVEPRDLLLYLGCNILRTAHLAVTIVEVLRAMGFELNAVGGPAYCCGIVHHLNGQPEAARRYVANSLRHFAAYEPKHVLVWCPSCHEHYDDVVTREREVPFPYEHVTAFVARHLDRLRLVRRVERRVAFHHHTGHPQPDLDHASAAAVLRAIPGIEVVPVDNPAALGRHCSPKYINAVGRPAWREHVRRIAREARERGADTLATIYHSCHREICDEEASGAPEIVNWVTILADAMGLETPPDWFKAQRLRADPEATFAEVRAWAEARGLDPQRVRDALARAFPPACA